jgi:hypothetical protein
MSSATTIRPDLDRSPPSFERRASASGRVALLFQASQAACERLDKLRPDVKIRDDLLR